jgi:hypothetical protein
MEASTTYLQKVRDASAWKYMSELRRVVAELESASSANLELTLDETDTIVNIDKTQATHPMLMIHARLHWTSARSGHTTEFQIPLAPAFLGNKKATTLLKAVRARLPATLEALKAKTKRLSIAVGTDAARACTKLGVILKRQTKLTPDAEGVLAAQALCQMHASNNTSVRTLKPLRIEVPTFTATVLLHKGWVFHNLKMSSLRSLKAEGKIVMDYVNEPPPEKEAYLRETLGLLEGYLSRDPGTAATTARSAAASRLANMLAASTFDEHGKITTLRHFCPFGHCDSPKQAAAKIAEDVETLCFPGIPGIPACNRWMKRFPNLCFWNGHFTLNICLEPLIRMSEKTLKDQEDKIGSLPDVDTLLGYITEDSVMAKIRGQYKKTLKFVQDETVKLKLSAAVTGVKVLFKKMGEYLTDSKFANDAKLSATDFAVPHRSPAYKTFAQYAALLADDLDSHWIHI